MTNTSKETETANSQLPPPIQTKRCQSCGKELPITDFDTDLRASDNHATECRACKEARRTARKRIAQADTILNPLAAYSPRQLMQELKRRGYTGKLQFTQTIDLQNI